MKAWRRWFPGWEGIERYDIATFRHDLVAGLVLSAVLVPAGMAYAQATGLPPVVGLYASVVPLIAYAVLGPSRVLVLGPDSSLTPLIAATIVPLAAGSADRMVQLASALAIAGGLLCIVAGLTKFGFLTDLLSLPVRYGYLNGIAATVIAGQLSNLFGFSTGADDLVTAVPRFVRGVVDGRAHATSTVLGLGVLAVILGLRRWAPRAPGILIGVATAMAAVAVFGLRERGVVTVGGVPRGLPGFGWPQLQRGDLGPLLAGAFGIAMVSFADTSVLSRAYAARTGRLVDADRELLALGAANVATGLFRGFSVSASQSRTPVAEAAGARTQVTGVVGALCIALLLVAAPGAFRDLPRAALAAVVIAAVASLIEVREVVRLAETRRSEFLLSVVAFLAVALTGAIRGVVIAIVLSLLVFVAKAWRPHTAVLVRVDRLKGYHDSTRHPEGNEVPGLVLFRFDAPLFFANAELFREQILALADRPGPTPTRWLVVTAEPITDIDATAAAMLDGLELELEQRGVVLAFAELKGHVREQLAQFHAGNGRPIPSSYRTIGEAVHAYLADQDVEWEDWEDRLPNPPVP